MSNELMHDMAHTKSWAIGHLRSARWSGSRIVSSTIGPGPTFFKPSLQSAQGSGSQRLYSFTDVVQLKVVKRLLDAGMSLKKNSRSRQTTCSDELASDRPLMDVTLLSDGSSIYAAHSRRRSR